jgi:glycosyltransferase involved in cell wall biosynthesis
MKSRIGFRMVLLLHDLIPVMFPYFYRDHDVALFGNYMRRTLAIADRIVVSSQTVAADCRAYCAKLKIVPPDIVHVPFGFDVGAAPQRAAAELPEGLAVGRYAMLVSTIEPRKGHRLLVRLWRRLLAQGVPQSTGFKLAFVGRPGWNVDDLLAEIRNDPQLARTVRVIANVSDDQLAMLYDGAAFCLYPSAYEGYGLPLIEAYSHGKAVLVSTGGALSEIAEGFSPCIDLSNEEAWYTTMREWIERPKAREPYEREILNRFRHPSWAEAAAQFFARI